MKKKGSLNRENALQMLLFYINIDDKITCS